MFAGGWTLEFAEAVCGPGSELPVLDGLEILVDQSLVRVDEGASGGTRFRMLETIREFAAEQLTLGGEEEEIRRRHAWHLMEMAEAAEPELLRKDRALLDRLEDAFSRLSQFSGARD